MITSVPPLVLRSCRGCSLDELAGSRVLFLREQVRDLRVQDFLRELIVGVSASSDFAGSFLVEILHCSEGGGVEQVGRTLKQFSHVYNCSSLSLSLLTCVYILLSLIIIIFICLIYNCA